MEKWKKMFRAEGFIQKEPNKFYNKKTDETILFDNGLIFAFVKNKPQSIKQSLLPACAAFIDAHPFVTEKREFVGILYKDTLKLTEMNKIKKVYRTEALEKTAEENIIGASYYNDDDIILVVDSGGIIHPISPKKINIGEEIDLHKLSNKFSGTPVYLGKLSLDGAAKKYFVTITKHNKVKKTLLSLYNNFKQSSILIGLHEDDEVIYAAPANDEDDIILISNQDKILRMSVSEFPEVERRGKGYKAFEKDVSIKSAVIASPDSFIIASGSYKGKMVKVDQIPFGGRSTNGRVSPDVCFLNNIYTYSVIVDQDNKIGAMLTKDIPIKPYKSVGVKIIDNKIKNIF